MTISKTPLQASKWLQLQMLLDAAEMEALLQEMGDVRIFLVGKVLSRGEELLSKEQFLENYRSYLSRLKDKDSLEALEKDRGWMSAAFTLSEEALFSTPVAGDKVLVRALKPLVQAQQHKIGYSALENQFRPMVLSKESIHWGLQFSYPQLYMNETTKQVEKVLQLPHLGNTELFRSIQKWVRENTIPTPFFVKGEKIRVPMRLGKACLSWINEHPQLLALGIQVVVE